MVFEEFPLPLTFYDDKSKQNRFKENISSSDIFNLWALNDKLIPFQFRNELGAAISLLEIYDDEDNLIVTLKKEMIESIPVAGYQYFIWHSAESFKLITDVLLDLDCGKYYLKVSFSTGQIPLYSEVFSSIDDITNYFTLEWRNDIGDIDPVYYGSGYRNRIYSDTFITKGVPTVELETEKDGFGNTVVISRRMINNYDFSLMVTPNYIIDALNFMALHDDISLNTKGGVRAGTIENVEVEQDQIELFAYWGVTVKFNQPMFYFSGSCPTPITPAPGPEEIIIFTGLPSNTFDLVYDANN